MQRVDIKIGFFCNNRCAFCVQGDKRSHHVARPLPQIMADLEEGRAAGAVGVVVTGGEPTLHETLLPTVRAARALGYATIQIQSNGRRFAYPGFAKQVVAAGANEFALALHGPNAALHDRLTEAPGAFDQTVAGIRNLKALGQIVLSNTVITTGNVAVLADTARLLIELGVDQFQLAFVHILGTAAANKTWLVPKKSEAMDQVRAALDLGRSAGVRCYTEAIPLCLMRGYEEHVAERIIPRTRIYDADETLADYTEYRLNEGKAKGPPCAACAASPHCEGPWREYTELFGWDELLPYTTWPPRHSS